MHKSGVALEASGQGVLATLLEEQNLSDEAVSDFIINLLFAGNETTSKTMLFAVYFLTHSPKATQQLLVRFPFAINNLNYAFLFAMSESTALLPLPSHVCRLSGI